MKAFPFVLFLFLLPLALRAQRVEIGLNAGPALSYRYLQSDPKAFKELFDDTERPILGYRAGLDVLLRPRASWQVGAGLLYSLRGFSSHLMLTDANGVAYDSRVAMHLYYLDVPVYVKYRFGGQEQKSFYALVGINNSFFLSEKRVVKEGPDYNTGELGVDFRRYNAGAIMGLGLRHQLTDKVSLEAGPQATLQLQNIFEGNTPAKRYLYTISLNLRAAYRL